MSSGGPLLPARLLFLLPLLLLLLLLLLQPSSAAVALRFRDVSANNGFLTIPRNKYWGATIADFDRDGRYDLMLCNHRDPAELYFSKGRSRFQYVSPILNRFDLHAFAADDLDGDGDLDIIIVRGGSSGTEPHPPIVFVMPGDRAVPTGPKQFGEQFGLGGIGMRGRSVGFADFDGDGDNDLLFVNTPNVEDTVWTVLYERTGSDRFSFLKNTGLEEAGGHIFAYVDANQDGFLDVLVIRFPSLELYVNTFPSTGLISFRRAPAAIADNSKMKFARAVAEIDCDNDGVFELLVVTGRPTRQPHPDFLLKLGNDGTYRDIRIAADGTSRLPETDHHYDVTHGDFDNDGLMDLYISRTSGDGVRRQDRLYRNRGNCRFVEDTPSSLFSQVITELGESTKAFDYDLDGRIDILSGSKNGTWRLYKNKTRRGALRAFLIVRVGRSASGKTNPKRDRHAMGAIVKVFCMGRVVMQRVGSSGQSHTQSFTETLHFGLGRCRKVDLIEIMYAGGLIEKVNGPIPVNSVVTVGRYNAKCPPKIQCDSLT